MKEINVYQTSDGKLYKYKEDAEEHQKYLDFQGWITNHSLEIYLYEDDGIFM